MSHTLVGIITSFCLIGSIPAAAASDPPPAVPNTPVASVATARDSHALDDFFTAFAKKRDGIKSLEAHFTQSTILPDQTDVTTGSLYYAQPRRLVMRYDKPPTTLLIDNHRFFEYEPDEKQLVVYDVTDDPQADIVFFGFDNDTAALRKSYDVSLLESDDPRGKDELLVKPKADHADDAYFKEAHIYFTADTYLPYKIRIIKEESQVITEVKDLAVNPKVDAAAAKLRVPAGTKVVLNDQVVETVGGDGKVFPDEGTPTTFRDSVGEDAVKVKELAPAAGKETPSAPAAPDSTPR